jgi:hypothetical protein
MTYQTQVDRLIHDLQLNDPPIGSLCFLIEANLGAAVPRAAIGFRTCATSWLAALKFVQEYRVSNVKGVLTYGPYAMQVIGMSSLGLVTRRAIIRAVMDAVMQGNQGHVYIQLAPAQPTNACTDRDSAVVCLYLLTLVLMDTGQATQLDEALPFHSPNPADMSAMQALTAESDSEEEEAD